MGSERRATRGEKRAEKQFSGCYRGVERHRSRGQEGGVVEEGLGDIVQTTGEASYLGKLSAGQVIEDIAERLVWEVVEGGHSE